MQTQEVFTSILGGGQMGKRIVVRIHSRKATEVIEALPRGYRSFVMEAALMAFIRSDEGAALLDSLGCRSRIPGGSSERRDVFGNLRGDFD